MLTVMLVLAVLLLLPPAGYVGGYFGLTIGKSRNLQSGGTCRVYRSMWEAILFMPAALIESAVTGEEVSPAWRDR